MNKIAAYLNEHLLGEVSSSKAMRRRYSRDASVLTVTPEIVVFPRVTNDIRKAARFAWQLAEKGHPLPITVRGLGGDQTGAAIGKGILVSTSRHLGNIVHIAIKDRLVHVQGGARLSEVHSALKWNGLRLPNAPMDGTVGGVIASNALGARGSLASSIEKLEVVLANGDLIETSRLSHRDVSKKLGLQTFEGEVYRKLSGLIEDNSEVIEQISRDTIRDTAGYQGIASVRHKDGSFDLTPLFVGSQGTLGVISEVVLKADFYAQDETRAIVLTQTPEAAADIVDELQKLEPTSLEVIDGELLRHAAEGGAEFAILGDVEQVGAVIYVAFNDFSDHAQAVKLKKLRKYVAKAGVGMVDSLERAPEEFDAVRGVTDSLQMSAGDDQAFVPLLWGAHIPAGRLVEYREALAEFATKHHVQLPLTQNVLTGTVSVYPTLKLDVVSDKQKLFKLLNEYATLIDSFGGAFVSDGGEGRLKANAAWAVMSDAEAALYEQIRAIFDPFATMNPGVKQKSDIRTLVSALRTSYDVSDQIS